MKNHSLILVDALTLVLKALKVKFVFGVSGANIEHLHDAIYRLGGNELSAVLAKGECSAAFMADGYARTQHTLGVCCATSGAGMMNLVGGIAEAYADNVPVLAIVGQAPTPLEGKGAFQDSSGQNNTVNALMLWQSMTKYVAKITDPAQFWDILEQALKSIFTGSLGPSVLLIPRNLFTATVPPKPSHFSTQLDHYRPLLPCESHLIQQLMQLLHTAQKPLVIVGKHAKYYKLHEAITQFVDYFDCKVATTFADVNAFRQDNPHYLGMIGICGHPHAHDFLKHEADLIIVIEDDFSIMTTASIIEVLHQTPLVYIGMDALKARYAITINLIIEGAADKIIEQCLTQQIKPHKISEKIESKSLCTDKIDSQSAHLSVRHALMAIAPFLSEVQQIFFDAGNCVASALHYLTFPAHVKTVIALGMGGMGYAMPAAIGAQFANNNNDKTMVMSGDGGFLITGLEIHTAVDYQLPLLFIIFNNNQHGMCVTRQQLFFKNRITTSTYSNVNIAQLTQGLGNEERLWCASADDISSLQTHLNDYYGNHSHKTGVLEIKIMINDIPPFVPFLTQAKS